MAALGAVTPLLRKSEQIQKPSGLITGTNFGSYPSQLKLLYPVQIITGTGQRVSINVFRDGQYVELQPQ